MEGKDEDEHYEKVYRYGSNDKGNTETTLKQVP